MNDTARAYVNWGRWVAACPNPACNSAEEIHPWQGYACTHVGCQHAVWPQTLYHCTECRAMAPIEWPPDAGEIWAALSDRPALSNRNWYPADHHFALRWGVPHGQSPAELRAEHAAQCSDR
jgi:hypothetical protein